MTRRKEQFYLHGCKMYIIGIVGGGGDHYQFKEKQILRAKLPHHRVDFFIRKIVHVSTFGRAL